MVEGPVIYDFTLELRARTTLHDSESVLGPHLNTSHVGPSRFHGHGSCLICEAALLRATSHTRLRACDHYTSSTLIGGEGGAGPSSLHNYARGTNKVCECKMNVKSTWILTWHRMDHVSWSLGRFSITSSWG